MRDGPPDMLKHFHHEAILCLSAAIRDAGDVEFRKDTLGYMKIIKHDIDDIFADRLGDD